MNCMVSINDLFGKGRKEIKKMKRNEFKEECETWRLLSDWLDPVVVEFLKKVGVLHRISTSMGKEFVGELLEAKWDLKTLELGVYEKRYDYNTGKYFWEKKILRIPAHTIRALEAITERVEEEKKEII